VTCLCIDLTGFLDCCRYRDSCAGSAGNASTNIGVPAVTHRPVEMQPSSFVPRKRDLVGSGALNSMGPEVAESFLATHIWWGGQKLLLALN